MKLVPPYFGTLAKVNKIMPTIAQLLLGFLVFPIACMLVELFLPGQLGNFITNTVSGIAIFEVWPDAFSTIAYYAPAELYMSYAEILTIACATAIMETGIISLCIMLCKNIGIVLQIKGAPVLQTIIGVFLGCIFCKSLSIYDEMEILFVYCVLLAFNLLILIIYEQELVRITIKTFLSASFAIIIAGMVAAYVTAAMMMIQGSVDLATGCMLLLYTFLPLAMMLIIDYFFLSSDR